MWSSKYSRSFLISLCFQKSFVILKHYVTETLLPLKPPQIAVNFPLNLHLEIYYSFIAVSCKFHVKKSQYIFCKSFYSKNVLKEITWYQQGKHIILTLPVSLSYNSLESKDFNLTVLFFRNHCYLSSAITTNCFAHEATIFSWVKQPLDEEKNHTANNKLMHSIYNKIQWMTQSSQSEYINE